MLRKLALLGAVCALVCACAAKQSVNPGMLYSFKSAPINMDLSFNKDGANAWLSGAVSNTGGYPLTLNIAVKMDASNIDVRVDGKGMEYRTRIQEEGQSLPLEYFSMELPGNSTQNLYMAWKDASAADKDTVTFYPVSSDGPMGESIFVDMGNLPVK